MTNKFILALICLLSLSFASCGKLEKQLNKKTEPQRVTVPTFSDAAFRNLCRQKDGRLARNDDVCIAPMTVMLPKYADLAGVATYPILEKFYTGMLIVTSGSSAGRVEVIYDGAPVPGLGIPGRALPVLGAGKKLDFYVSGSGYSDVSATVWTCYDNIAENPVEMRKIVCPDALIPR